MLNFLNLAISSKFTVMFLVTFLLLSLVTRKPGAVAKVFTKALVLLVILTNLLK